MNSSTSTTESITADSSAIPLDVATEPTTVEPSSVFVRFVLNQLNVARLLAMLAVNEIETTITALSAGLISPEVAILMARRNRNFGVVVKHFDYFDDLVERLVRERQAEIRQKAEQTHEAAQSTWDAVLWVLREYGEARIYDPWVTNRLAQFSPAQIDELVAALTRLKYKPLGRNVRASPMSSLWTAAINPSRSTSARSKAGSLRAGSCERARRVFADYSTSLRLIRSRLRQRRRRVRARRRRLN
jgi:hypothetical protein